MVDGVVGNAREHIAQVGFGIDAVKFGGADQAVNCGCTFATGVGAGEQVVLAAQGHCAQGSFRRVGSGHLVDRHDLTGYAQFVHENFNGSNSRNLELNHIYLYGFEPTLRS